MAPRAKEPTGPLKPLHVVGLSLLFPIFLTTFVVGMLGLRILLDEDGTSSLSHSRFGHYYKQLIRMNPFFSAVFFNGGMIGTMFSVTKLVEHAQAVKRAKHVSAVAPPVALAAASGDTQPETKKHK